MALRDVASPSLHTPVPTNVVIETRNANTELLRFRDIQFRLCLLQPFHKYFCEVVHTNTVLKSTTEAILLWYLSCVAPG